MCFHVPLMKVEQRIEELRRELVIAERNRTSIASELSAEQIQLSAQRQAMLQPQS
jgi:hypothetical protein